MKASKLIWKNGQMVAWQDATVHVMAHGLQYGTTVFEGIRCYATHLGPAIFRLGAHTRRFVDSARAYRMVLPYQADEINAACRRVISDNGLTSAYIRPLAYRGYGSIAVDPQDKCPVEMAIAAFEFGAYLGATAVEQGIDVCVTSWHRLTSASNPVLAKAGGHYTNAYLIAAEAHANGFGEGIAVTAQGHLAEASASNLFLVRSGTVYTPPLSAGILGGITRDTVIELARSLDLRVVEQVMPRDVLYSCDEMFLTGTAAEITPVRSVDRIPVGNGLVGPVTQSIQQAFFGLFDGKTEDRWAWLDLIEST
ncbi:MAG TPA: branched-chain amino acid transaminase [Pirellulaceae bacterium]|nr:branched-chain amino acid transaminase [Pirellulaceae bacterium]